jgi:hypothetical protein
MKNRPPKPLDLMTQTLQRRAFDEEKKLRRKLNSLESLLQRFQDRLEAQIRHAEETGASTHEFRKYLIRSAVTLKNVRAAKSRLGPIFPAK